MGIGQTRSDSCYSTTSPTGHRNFVPLRKMHMWAKIKKRLNKDRRRIARLKAITGVELVGAGAALTGDSIIEIRIHFVMLVLICERYNNVNPKQKIYSLFVELTTT